MKVQRRCNPKEVYEVLNESPTHYIIDRGYNDIALRKADYEPVQEWVDVTKECNLHNQGSYVWLGHKNEVCGHHKNVNTRISVDELGQIRVERKQ